MSLPVLQISTDQPRSAEIRIEFDLSANMQMEELSPRLLRAVLSGKPTFADVLKRTEESDIFLAGTCL